MSTKQKDIYLVIGGSGFVGRHIVEQLVARGDAVSVFDITPRYHDVPFYAGDITDEQQLLDVIRKTGTTCIMHTASPPPGLKNEAIYYKVNVEGTRAVVNAALASGVRRLVYTSSAGIVFDGRDVMHLDERAPYPEKPFDAYCDSKAKGEALVLEANRKGGLLTVSLRPGGIYGPGERHIMTAMYDAFKSGQTHVQIGANGNLVDYIYVGDLARAHIMAADKLIDSEFSNALLDDAALQRALPSISVTTGFRRVPTSKARPLGPYVTPPPDFEALEAAFNAPYDPQRPAHPIVRNCYDQFSNGALRPSNRADGEVFFITSGEPIYHYDFFRSIWNALDPPTVEGRKRAQQAPIVITQGLAIVLGYLGETWARLTNQEPLFSRFRVTYICATRYHSIEKARRVLGWKPEVGFQEGVQRMVEGFKAEKGLSY